MHEFARCFEGGHCRSTKRGDPQQFAMSMLPGIVSYGVLIPHGGTGPCSGDGH
jgi:hypothetical protein